MKATFGQVVEVTALAEPWLATANGTGVRFECRQRRLRPSRERSHSNADDGSPDMWPGQPCPGSESPVPAMYEPPVLRWRRVPCGPLVGVVVGRLTTRAEGQFCATADVLIPSRRVQLVQLCLRDGPRRARIHLAHPVDVSPSTTSQRSAA